MDGRYGYGDRDRVEEHPDRDERAPARRDWEQEQTRERFEREGTMSGTDWQRARPGAHGMTTGDWEWERYGSEVGRLGADPDEYVAGTSIRWETLLENGGRSLLEEATLSYSEERTPASPLSEAGRTERQLGGVAEGMDVCDPNGDKVGVIRRVYLVASGAPVGSLGSASSRTEGYLQVATGFLSLGKTLYVPASQVRSVSDGAVIIDAEKDWIDTLGWDRRPPALEGA